MNKKRVYLLVFVSALLAFLFSLKQVVTQISPTNGIPPRTRELAKRILQSPMAKYLSGSGLNALNLVSGRVSAPQKFKPGKPARALPFQSNRFQLMVNDPSLDLFSDLDITSQSETAVAANGSNVVVAYNNSRALFFASNSGMGYSRSADGGVTFTDLGLLTGPTFGFNFGDPALVADRSGNFYAAELSLDFTLPLELQNTIGISKSTDGGIAFGTPVYPAQTFVPGIEHFGDKDLLAVDNTGGPHNGNLYVSWTDFTFDFNNFTFAAPIVVSRSTDGGTTFSTPVQLSPPEDTVSGAEPAVGPGGEVYVTWFRFSPPTIFVAKSTDGGVSFGAPVLVASLTPIGFLGGQLLGNFRVNSFPRIDVDPGSGTPYIVYAANSPGTDGADVYLTRSANGGATWSNPIRVNHDPGTNDQFFPDIAVNRQGIIEAIWYDRRLDPSNLRIDVFKAQSLDGGLSFGPNHRLTLTSFLPAVGYDPLLNPVYMGDYIDIKADTTSDGTGFNFFLAWGDCRRIITTPQGTRPDQDVFFTVDH